jgi:hypothetical protein
MNSNPLTIKNTRIPTNRVVQNKKKEMYEIPSFLMNKHNEKQKVHKNTIPGMYPKNNTIDAFTVDVDSQFKNGYMGGVIDASAHIEKRNLYASPYATSGFRGAHYPDMQEVDVESKIRGGLSARAGGRACGPYADLSIDTFIPLVPCLKGEVQNVKHIIPEYWVRGGADTRTVVRNIDYLRMCGFKH